MKDGNCPKFFQIELNTPIFVHVSAIDQLEVSLVAVSVRQLIYPIGFCSPGADPCQFYR